MITIRDRLRVIGRARRLIANRAESFAQAAARPDASAADILVAEVMPLLAACRWLERRAERILATTRPGGRPVWLFGTRLLVRRVPLGRVLVIGPSNYPLFLPGVQTLHALAAGNTVLVKPAPGCSASMALMRDTLVEAGLPPESLTVLGEEPAIPDRVDHVVLTGSAATGRAVLAELAPRLVSATMELSGRDAMIVLDGADIELAARAAAFGLQLNGGRTCIAPRRIIVVQALATLFVARLEALLAGGGARVVRAEPDEAWVHQESFTAVAALLVAPDEAASIAIANAGPYALGASVFGPPEAARRVATSLRAGCVVVNDMIAPTAHPALPFGGAGDSGFGVTRGAEGLLAMTRPQAVVERTRPSMRHLTILQPETAGMVARLLRGWYGSLARRPHPPTPRGPAEGWEGEGQRRAATIRYSNQPTPSAAPRLTTGARRAITDRRCNCDSTAPAASISAGIACWCT